MEVSSVTVGAVELIYERLVEVVAKIFTESNRTLEKAPNGIRFELTFFYSRLDWLNSKEKKMSGESFSRYMSTCGWDI